MTAPVAIVDVRVLRIEGYDVLLKAGKPLFVMAEIGDHVLGRSRRLDAGGHDFENERSHWAREVHLSGQPLRVGVDVWAENGDDGAKLVGSQRLKQPYPYISGVIRFGSPFEVTLEVVVTLVPNVSPTIFVPRVAGGTSKTTRATVADSVAVAVEIDLVRGLYQPVRAPLPPGDELNAVAVPGYTGTDNLGRIYLNRQPNGDYERGTQYIDLLAKVHDLRGRLPADLRVKWVLLSRDDPFNDRPDVHPDAGSVIDPDDYLSSTTVHIGAGGADNEGKPARTPRWESVGDFAITDATGDRATTSVQFLRSAVRLHCPDIAGDRVMVRAFCISSSRLQSFSDATGVMTMWNRIDIEYLKMKSARALDMPLQFIRRHFEPACVQFDIRAAAEIEDKDPLDEQGSSWPDAARGLVDSRFKHKKQGGWFCIVAANNAFPPAEDSPEDATSGMIDTFERPLEALGAREYFTWFRKLHGDAFAYIHVGGERIYFSLHGEDVGYRLWRYTFKPMFANPTFSAARLRGAIDNPERFALNPSLYGAQVYPAGKVPEDATKTRIDIYMPVTGGSYITLGGATVRSLNESGEDCKKKEACKHYDDGACVIFTRAERAWDGAPHRFAADIGQAIVHELVHMLGLPHVCLHWDTWAPRKQSCVMNYGYHALLGDDGMLEREHIGKNGLELCGEHIKELRRTQLHLLKGTQWE